MRILAIQLRSKCLILLLLVAVYIDFVTNLPPRADPPPFIQPTTAAATGCQPQPGH